MVDEATLREWLVNLGTRDARQKVAHLICELLVRLRVVGLAEGRGLQVADHATGSGRYGRAACCRAMRANGLVEFEAKVLTILDFDAMVAISNFNPNYLHLIERAHANHAH